MTKKEITEPPTGAKPSAEKLPAVVKLEPVEPPPVAKLKLKPKKKSPEGATEPHEAEGSGKELTPAKERWAQTEREIQADMATWVSTIISTKSFDITKLANRIGIRREALSRVINGGRKLSLHEVVLIARETGKSPPLWNKVAEQKQPRTLLPLLGNISSAVWRKRGSNMIIGMAPIEPIITNTISGLNQVCYFVESGKHAGEYAVCVDEAVRLDTPAHGDAVVIEETRKIHTPDPEEVTRTVLKRVRKIDGRTILDPFDPSEGDVEIDLSSPEANIKITAVVIGFFRPLSL